MTGERKTLDTGIVTLSALTFHARIASHLRSHAITHLAFDVVPVGVGVTERTFGVYALRELGDGSGAAAVVAVAWSDVADEGVDRVLAELDRLDVERARARERELDVAAELLRAEDVVVSVDDDDIVVVRPRADGVVVGVFCTACSGTGQAERTHTSRRATCDVCNGSGLSRRLN